MIKKEPLKLFEYQEKTVQKCMDYMYSSSTTPQIVVAPTASGKSLIISALAKRWNRPCLVLQPSKELLEQNIGKLFDMGGEAAIFSASLNTKEIDYLTYATLGSIKSKVEYLKKFGVDTVYVDEVHYGYPPEPSSMFMCFMRELAPKKVIGFTATPFLLRANMSGSQLKMINRLRPGYFKEFCHIIQIKDIIALNRWSPLQYKFYDFDESSLELNSSGAEFTEDSVREAIKTQGVNNNIYLEIVSQLPKRKGILVFMDSVGSAETMANFLNNKNICKAAFLTGTTTKKERSRIVSEFKKGKIQVLLNFNVLSTGFDYQELDCVIMGRPTNSLAVWYQIVGRGTRVHPNKKECLIVDFCNNLKRFGKVEDLVVEYVPEWGWAVTNKNVVLTNVMMNNLRITKQEILAGKVDKQGRRKHGMKMFMGIHKGEYVSNLPLHYIKWSLANMDFTRHPAMMALKKEMSSVIEANDRLNLLESQQPILS